jgi:quinol monooxygenase YgiN
MSLYVFASVTPKPEHVADVESEFRVMVAASRQEPGNRRYDLLGSVEGGTTSFHVFEEYVDHEALEAHRTSDHYRAYRARVADWLAEAPNVKVLTAVDALGR